MRTILKGSVLFVFLCHFMLISGCEQSLTPIEVAEKFWTGIQMKDTILVKKTLSQQSINDLEQMDEILPVKEFTLTRTVIEGDNASVDTDVIIDGDEPYQIPLETILVREDEKWKVEYEATVANISSGNQIAKIIGSIEELSEEFSEEMEKSMEEFKKAIPEIKRQMKKAEKQFREIVPQLKDKFEELVRKIEESLEQPQQNEEQTQQGTIQI